MDFVAGSFYWVKRAKTGYIDSNGFFYQFCLFYVAGNVVYLYRIRVKSRLKKKLQFFLSYF